MYTTIYTAGQFRDEFIRMGWGKNFTYEGSMALFKYFEQYEEDTGERIELDVIAICCDWAEYTPEELVSEYGSYLDRDDDIEDSEYAEKLAKELTDRTTVIECGNGNFIIQAF